MQDRILLSLREQKYAATNHVVPYYHFRLREEADPQVLEKAAEQALAIHPLFRKRILRGEDGLYYYVTNEAPPVIAPFEPERKITYGTEAYHFYPWQIFVSGRDIFITGSHAVSDGTGYLGFMRSVLHLYFSLRGHAFSTASETDLAGDPDPSFSPFAMAARESCVSRGVPSFPPGSRLPEELFETDLSRLRPRNIILRRQEIASRSRGWETTNFSVISCYAARAVQTLMAGREGIIKIRVPVNLRQTFPCETDRDFSMGFSLNYDTAKMRLRSCETVASVFRSQLDLLSDRAGLVKKFRGENGRMDHLRQHPEILDTMLDSFRAARRIPGAEVTYTHISKTGFSAELEALVERFSAETQPMPEKTIIIFATTWKEEIILHLYDTLKDNAFSSAFEKALEEDGLSFGREAVPPFIRAEHVIDQF